MSLKQYINKNHPLAATKPFNNFDKSQPLKLETARVNLVKCCEILEECNTNYRVVFGTLLGLYRSGDLIPHDSDMDLAVLSSEENKLIIALDALVKAGFTIVRSAREVVSVAKDGDYIDLYLFNRSLSCNTCVLSKLDFETDNCVTLLGKDLKTIADPVPFFKKYYGGDWETPIRGISGSLKNGKRKKK